MGLKDAFRILTALAVVTSCNDEPSTIGSDFFQDGGLEVLYVDSLTLKVSTVQYDSVITSSAIRLLAGFHEDEQVGKLKASAFFQIAPDAALSLDEHSTSYSRTVMMLVPDGYSQYDTAQRITVNAHEVVEDIELDHGYLFNTSSFTHNEKAIGSLTFLPRPNTSDTLEIPLSDAFGNRIFSLAQKEANEVSSPSAFIEEFKGIALMPDTTKSGAIIGYQPTPSIRIYYWDRTRTPSEERYLTIKGGAYLKFNQLRSNRKGTGLDSLSKQRTPVDSRLTDNIGFIQGTSGLALRVEIPYLRDLMLQNKNLTITDAILQMPVANGDKNTPLPMHLAISAADYKNDSYGTFEHKASLVTDHYLGRDTRYEADVRSFVMGQLQTEELNRNALLFSLDGKSFVESMDIVKIGDQRHTDKMILKLYCVVIKNHE